MRLSPRGPALSVRCAEDTRKSASSYAWRHPGRTASREVECLRRPTLQVIAVESLVTTDVIYFANNCPYFDILFTWNLLFLYESHFFTIKFINTTQKRLGLGGAIVYVSGTNRPALR